MAGEVLHLEAILVPDQLALRISEYWLSWESFRQPKMQEWQEIQRYIFATDTTKTSNSKLPWSNKTTIPKLCQIRDNLFSNYLAAMFPKRKWLIWEGDTEADEDKAKKEAIESYMAWVIDRNEFYEEISKILLDYIDYGNAFMLPVWIDRQVQTPDKTQVGYVGPMIRRIAPPDIVFNPTAPNFASSPKIVRSLMSIGEVKEMLEKASESLDPDEKKAMMDLYAYMKEIRHQVAHQPGTSEDMIKDVTYQIQGFDSYRMYLESNIVEVLTFYGDIYDEETDKLLRNQVIKIVDRHKVIQKSTHPSFFGTVPIYHVGWRIRPDNIWAMGPLDNLVGMQYRIDHLENMKADVWDLTAYPPLKIKGYVENFEWGPFERIYIGDGDGDVEMMHIDPQVLQANTEISILEAKMEEMAGSPKEAMGFRTPGEKTKYEVQRLENAASRIFQNKIAQFERQGVENALNAMLELARRKMTSQVIRVFNNELKFANFNTLTPEDITGNGRIKPIAARHFAEKAQLLQDLSGFFSSALGQDPTVNIHFSGVELAKLHEHLLDLEDYNIVTPYIRISEQSEAQHFSHTAEEQTMMQTKTASGIGNDYDTVPGPTTPGNAGPVGLTPQGSTRQR